MCSNGVHIFSRSVLCYFAYIFGLHVYLLQIKVYWSTAKLVTTTAKIQKLFFLMSD
jgi:hypothetical protein